MKYYLNRKVGFYLEQGAGVSESKARRCLTGMFS